MKAIVLAAGKGVRMQSDLPKVLHELRGKPLLMHVTDTLKSSGVDEIVIVVGYKAELVRERMGESFKYAYQHEQLGTGHAVLQAEEALNGYAGEVIVTCGDAPMISKKSFLALGKEFTSGAGASLLTMELGNPFGYGRIVRSKEGFVIRIIEEKDAAEAEKKINEVNVGTYIFDSATMFEGLKNTGNNNAQKEYYLPDMIEYVTGKGGLVTAVKLDSPVEGAGVNSKDQLAELESVMHAG